MTTGSGRAVAPPDGRPRGRAPAGLSLILVAALAALALPLFAHGCHGADEDHEPGFAPVPTRSEPAAGP
jgi:hypothetical protein